MLPLPATIFTLIYVVRFPELPKLMRHTPLRWQLMSISWQGTVGTPHRDSQDLASHMQIDSQMKLPVTLVDGMS